MLGAHRRERQLGIPPVDPVLHEDEADHEKQQHHGEHERPCEPGAGEHGRPRNHRPGSGRASARRCRSAPTVTGDTTSNPGAATRACRPRGVPARVTDLRVSALSGRALPVGPSPVGGASRRGRLTGVSELRRTECCRLLGERLSGRDRGASHRRLGPAPPSSTPPTGRRGFLEDLARRGRGVLEDLAHGGRGFLQDLADSGGGVLEDLADRGGGALERASEVEQRTRIGLRHRRRPTTPKEATTDTPARGGSGGGSSFRPRTPILSASTFHLREHRVTPASADRRF